MLAASADPYVRALLRNHPHVAEVAEGAHPGIDFDQGSWPRSVRVGDATVEQHGLAELADNNPWVCADVVSVPSPASTLALIALGPLTIAGLLAEEPTFMVSGPADETDIARYLETAGWTDGVVVQSDEVDLGGVLAATAIAAIRTPGDLDELDELYAERFGRSFFVHADDESDEWHASRVLGTPQALYRLRISPDDPVSLLTVRVMADRNGKCGAAQVVHAMNIMCGFEESLGIYE